MKATHYGTCQICNNKQKAPDGLLSKHGYTVDYGFFNGVCHGAEHLPFEKDRSVLGEVIQNFQAHIESKIETRNKVEKGELPVLVKIYLVPENNGFGQGKYHWVEYCGLENDKPLIRADKLPSGKVPMTARLDDDGIWHTRVQYYGDNTPLSNYLHALDKEILRNIRHLRGMKDRYNSWKEKELEPVTTRLIKETSV